MMGFITDLIGWALILSGSAFIIIGAVGTVRFPDFWSRLHAVSVTDSGGMILLILGMCVQSGFTLITVKLIAIGLFLFITGPTGTHAVANAALVSGMRPPEGDLQHALDHHAEVELEDDPGTVPNSKA